MQERQKVNLEPTDNYTDFLESIRRNMDASSKTVLLVDDERSIRMKVSRDVRSFDPQIVIHEAANGSEALEKLKMIRSSYSRDPLFIVLDLNMPVMDGWEVIKHLKQEYEEQGKDQGIPILVLSSTSGEKGMLFTKQSVHGGKTGYTPLVAVAKEVCTDKREYDAAGEKGLITWLKFFMKAR